MEGGEIPLAELVFDHTILVAFDFDGTLTMEDELGKPFRLNYGALEWVKMIQELPVETCLWSCRHSKALYEAVEALYNAGIVFDYINEDNGLRNSGRKINVDVYVDDKANTGIDWPNVYRRVQQLCMRRDD